MLVYELFVVISLTANYLLNIIVSLLTCTSVQRKDKACKVAEFWQEKKELYEIVKGKNDRA